MLNKNVICVFTKCPRPGLVKKRLETVLGQKNTAFLARAFLMDIISTSLKVENASVVIAHWPPDSAKDIEEIIYLFSREEKDKRIQKRLSQLKLLQQQGDDLGERMANAFKRLFETGARKVLIIGADVPQLHPSIFRAALELLERKQVVLGPTFDGGYYMIGMKKAVPEVFDGIEWGSPSVYRETADRLNNCEIDWQELELSYDIDTPENLQQLYLEIDTLRLTGEDTICYHTEQCLKNLTE